MTTDEIKYNIILCFKYVITCFQCVSSLCFKSMFQVYDMFQICFKYGYVYFKILPSYMTTEMKVVS